MNVTLSDVRLIKFLKNKHSVDLTHRIEIVRNWVELPRDFEQRINIDVLRRVLNLYGPLYYLKGNKMNYLTQERNNGWFCVDSKGNQIPLSKVYEDVGVPEYLGMMPDELYKVFNSEVI